MGNEINIIFYIAGIAIVVGLIQGVLKHGPLKDWSDYISIIGAIVIMFILTSWIQNLFQK